MSIATSFLAKLSTEKPSPPVPDVTAATRIKRACDVVSQWQTLFNEDYIASRDRAVVQSMADRNAPYSDSTLRSLGITGITNVNWGDLGIAQQEAEKPYNSILNSMSNFGIVPFKASVKQSGSFTDAEIGEKETTVAEELHWMITRWRDFRFRWKMLSHFYIMWGVGFTYRDDDLDWRWRVSSLQDVKIPRGTQASVNEVDRIFLKADMTPSDLFRKIQDPEMGRLAGWNADAINKSCVNAQPKPLNTQSPEEMQAMWKDNSVFSGNTNIVIQVVHGFVKEVDGTVSHYIADYSLNSEDAGFLYEKKGKYASMSEFINAYLFGVGTNGDFHSIRGNAFNLFPSASALNKLRCKLVDKANDEANTFLSTDNEDATIDNMMVPRGPYFQLSTGVSFVERSTPAVAGNLVPAIEAMAEVFGKQSSGMAPRTTSQGERGQKTKYELQRKDEMDSTLTSDSMDMFIEAWHWDYREIVKRVINPDLQPEHPGGAEAYDFRRRCEERGIPYELLQQLDFDSIQINTGIGRGSSAERRSVLANLNDRYYGRLDPEGQNILTRDSIASETDYRYALTLVPRQAGQRPPVDKQIANTENQVLKMGGDAVVVQNQNHIVHVGTHLELLQAFNDALSMVQIELKDAIPVMQKASEHAGEHMQFIDPESEPYRQFKQGLQQLNEVITNGAKHLEADQRKEALAKGEAAPDTSDTPPGVYGQAVDARARLAMQAREHQTSEEIKKREADQKLLINDVFAQQKLQHEAAKFQLQAAQQQQKASQPKATP
jgi:hypothetical protein